jgi:hypothetical protein
MGKHDSFLLNWFGLHGGRELGDPFRFFTNNPNDLVSLVEECAVQRKKCFCSVQPFRSRDVVFGLEKLFFDYDSEADPPDLEKVWRDVLSLVEQLRKEFNIEPLIIRTYRGFHVYVFLWNVVEFNPNKQSDAKEIYTFLQKTLLANKSYETLDPHVIGDIVRFGRVPYSLHEKGVECTPVDLNRQPLQLESVDYYRQHGIKEPFFREAVQKVKDKKFAREIFEVFDSFKPKPRVKGSKRKWIIRPCFTETLKSGEMDHGMRIALVYEAYCAGLNRDQTADLFHVLGDFNEEKTRYQINWLLDHAQGKEVKPYKCKTIEQKGWCLKKGCLLFKG